MSILLHVKLYQSNGGSCLRIHIPTVLVRPAVLEESLQVVVHMLVQSRMVCRLP